MDAFTFTKTDGNGRFRAIGRPSLFTEGVEFTLTGVVTGQWHDANSKLINKEGCESIRFQTSLSNGEDGQISLTRFFQRFVAYDSHRKLKVLNRSDFTQELSKFLTEKIGFDEADRTLFKGTAKEVGEKALTFFTGKTIVCKPVTDIFFRNTDDKGNEHFDPPYESVIQFSFKG